jgi:hypothetical protein
MWPRLLFLLVTTFFVVMNVLLWRAEVAGRNKIGSPVPVHTVWQKMVTAPDISSLEIRHRDKKIGFFRWIPTVGERMDKNAATDSDLPEGMVKETLGFDIDINGNVALDEQNRLRFSFDLKLSTNHDWQEFVLRLNLRPNQWQVSSVASEKTLHLVSDDFGRRQERVLKFSDLRNPQKVLTQLAGPLVPGLLGMAGLPMDLSQIQNETTKLKWEARNDWLTMGNARIRVYRLTLKLLDRYEIGVLVSRVGEILRVELPEGVLLVNEALVSF